MKLRTVFHLLGLRPGDKSYGYKVVQFVLSKEGPVNYAQWQHPKESPKEILQEHVDQLRQYINEGDVAIDIGAHTGDSTLPLALAAGPTGRVLALEPNPFVYKVLCKNVELNKQCTIEPLSFAATETDGPIEFEYSDAGYCNGGRHEDISTLVHGHVFRLQVEGRNLERYLREERSELVDRISFIKVDAEGYDATILASLQDFIREYQPVIKAEFYKHSPKAKRKRMYGLLRSLGYDIFKVRDHCDRLGDRMHEHHLDEWTHFDVMCVPVTRKFAVGC